MCLVAGWCLTICPLEQPPGPEQPSASYGAFARLPDRGQYEPISASRLNTGVEVACVQRLGRLRHPLSTPSRSRVGVLLRSSAVLRACPTVPVLGTVWRETGTASLVGPPAHDHRDDPRRGAVPMVVRSSGPLLVRWIS